MLPLVQGMRSTQGRMVELAGNLDVPVLVGDVCAFFVAQQMCARVPDWQVSTLMGILALAYIPIAAVRGQYDMARNSDFDLFEEHPSEVLLFYLKGGLFSWLFSVPLMLGVISYMTYTN